MVLSVHNSCHLSYQILAPTWLVLRFKIQSTFVLEGLVGRLGPSWVVAAASLGRSWAVSGASCAQLGGVLGASWERLEAVLKRLCGFLGRLVSVLWASWKILEAFENRFS